MTKKTRTGLFIICVLAFLVFSPALILYSQGYRVDFKNRRLTQTGAVYLKISPKDGEVYIDGKFKKKGDFLFGSVLIDNLLPRNYLLEVKKDGYSSWKKKLEIKSAGVTEAKNVVLFPEKNALAASFQVLAREIDGLSFWPSPSEKKLILKKTDAQGWYLTLFDLAGRFEEIILKEKDLSKKGGDSLMSLRWSADSQKLILQTAFNEQERYFLLDLQKKPVSPLGREPLGYLGVFEKIDFNESDAGKFFLLKDGSLLSGEFALKTTSLLVENVLAFEYADNRLYLLDQAGFVYRQDNLADEGSRQKVIDEPLEIQAETGYSGYDISGNPARYELRLINSKLFLREGEKLSWLDENTRLFEEIAPSAQDFKVSADREKLVYFNSSEIWVFFLQDIDGQPARKKGDKILLARFSEKINDVFWIDDDYIVFDAGNVIRSLEIDDRDQPNLAELAGFKDAAFSLSRLNKKAQLLILSQGSLEISGTLLP